MNFLETTIYRIILKTYLFFEETGRQNSFERFSYLRVLTERLTEECLDAWQRELDWKLRATITFYPASVEKTKPTAISYAMRLTSVLPLHMCLSFPST